jgi:hypothetical protein
MRKGLAGGRKTDGKRRGKAWAAAEEETGKMGKHPGKAGKTNSKNGNFLKFQLYGWQDTKSPTIALIPYNIRSYGVFALILLGYKFVGHK